MINEHLTVDSAFTEVWSALLYKIWSCGEVVSPRGRRTFELDHHTIRCSMQLPVLQNKERKLSYQFMAAEAYWILTGRDRVDEIVKYNERLSEFSDDGVSFYGAYGPPIVAQLPYVIDKLVEDPNTRQAGLTIWRASPPPTKDVPCTIAIWFRLKDGDILDVHVFMRSSDVWLGLPYDVFTFSCLGYLVCCYLNSRLSTKLIFPRHLYLTAVSSHLYEHNFKAARSIIAGPTAAAIVSPTPSCMYTSALSLMENLKELRDTRPGDPLRWWEDRWRPKPTGS